MSISAPPRMNGACAPHTQMSIGRSLAITASRTLRTILTRMRTAVRRTLDAVGLGDPARRLRDRLLPTVNPSPPVQNGAPESDAHATEAEIARSDDINRRDDEHLALLMAFALRSDSNCVDVGAHEGLFLKDMLRVAPLGRHIGYEPIPWMYEPLVTRFPNIDVRNRALSNVDGESTFTVVRDLPGYSGFRERTYPREVHTETISVVTERFDDHVPDGWRLDLLKVDVEGAEALVFEGAMATIRRDQPIIAFEHGRGAADHYGTTPRDLFTMLTRDAGLKIFDMDGAGPYEVGRFEDAFDSGTRWNWVARP